VVADESDWINIRIECKSLKIRQMVVNRIFEFCMSDDLLDEEYVQKLKSKPELNFSSSLEPDGRYLDG
jgi:hypothetical protein